MLRRLPFLLVSSILALAGCSCDPPPTDPDGGMSDGDVPMLDGDMGTDGGGDPSDLFTPPTITVCNDDLPAPTEGRCEITPGDASMLITGDVLTPGEVFRGGQVLVGADGRIACVGCDCADAAGAATTVVCPDVVISPSLINAHDHVTYANSPPYAGDEGGRYFTEERYEHRHEWRSGLEGHTRIPNRPDGVSGSASTEQELWLELRQLMSGTTAIFGSGGAEGLLRNLDTTSQLEGLEQPRATYDVFPLGTSKVESGCTGFDFSGDANNFGALDAYVPHVSEGIDLAARNELLCIVQSGTPQGARDFLAPKTAIIHGVGVLPADIAQLAIEDVELIWSPRSNITLYGDTARVTEYAHQGVPIGLGTDWVRSGSMNMLRELACADSFNQNHLAGFFPDEQLWLMATRNNAQAFRMDEAIGTLAEGMVADIALYDASAEQDHRAVLNAGPEDVVLVLRGGQVMYGDAAVVGALRTGCDEMGDVCGEPKQVCLDEIGMGFEALAAANGDQYDLFFCDVPENEPSCLPARTSMGGGLPDAMVNGSNYYSGMSSADDMDGDGLLNADDNCPSIFNPIRPLDNGMQADGDGDGMGDACDPTAFDASDLDGDGTPNEEDNCPQDANPGQEDGDGDMLGDLCDACPARAVSPGTETVYGVHCGAIPLGGTLDLTGLAVTALADNGFYAQQLEGSADYDGADYSGIFVYTDTAPTVARGDVVDVMGGTVADYFGLTQVATPTAVNVTASGMEPAPLVIEPAEIATDGARADALQSVLVRVETVTAMTAPDEFDEFIVDDGLYIGDSLFLVNPPPSAGTMYDFIQGPLTFAFSNTKILPRELGDIGFGSLQLAPDAINVPPGGTVEVTVVIPMEATTATPIMLTIASTLDGIFTCMPLEISTGARVGTTTCMAADTMTEGTGTLTASYGGEMDTSTVTVAEAPALFFSEYVEGSGSGNKALEIVNIGGSPADLSACEVRRYSNGGTSPSAVTLTGSLGAGDVYTICNGGIEGGITCDQSSGVINHNGNDAYDLFCGGMVVDTIGRIGEEPTESWSGGDISTKDHVLTRMCDIMTGDPDGSDAFDPSVEWNGTPWDEADVTMTLGNRNECLAP